PFSCSTAPPPPQIYPLSLHDALPISSDGADRARMNDEVEWDVRFDGATARLRGRLRPPIGSAWGSLVMSHGRSEDMGSLLLAALDRKSTRLNSSHLVISYAVFCLKKK